MMRSARRTDDWLVWLVGATALFCLAVPVLDYLGVLGR